MSATSTRRNGTTVIDVADPRNPRIVAEIAIPHGLHSHKVRAANGVMVVNREHHGRAADGQRPGRGGLIIYDIANPRQPRQIRHWECDGNGVHRFTFDGRYAYISPQIEGYVGNIVMILDLKDPAQPEEVGRWWMPGQWKAGGETADWKGQAHRCHHPIRRGDRLYVSYWHGGVVILDIADMAHPSIDIVVRLEPALPVAHPFGGADRADHQRPALPARRRRGRAADGRSDGAGDVGLHLDGRHHRREASRADRQLSRSPVSKASATRR